MPILNIVLSQVGTVGVDPSIAYISTNDTLAEVTTSGYLNKAVAQGYAFTETMMCLVSNKTSPSAAAVQVDWLEVSKSGANWSLVLTSVPGAVTLPTIANHMAIYTGTDGTLSKDATTAINGGNIQAGLSGTAGYLASFPSASSKGSLRLTAVANTGNTLVTISNAAHAQESVYTIPDVGGATGDILVKGAALISGNLIIASGTAGKVADGGFAMKSVAAAAAAGGAAAQSFTDAFCTSGSNVIGNWKTQANPVSVLKIVPGNGSFVVTSSGDAGVGTFNYIITK